MGVKFNKRGFFQRIFGIPLTKKPLNENSFIFKDGRVEVDLSKCPELKDSGTAIRLEGKELSKRILLIHGDDGRFSAYHNRCGHAGRRLDPVDGENTVQCCSVSKTTYSCEGNPIHGPVKKELKIFEIEKKDNKLFIKLG